MRPQKVSNLGEVLPGVGCPGRSGLAGWGREKLSFSFSLLGCALTCIVNLASSFPSRGLKVPKKKA